MSDTTIAILIAFTLSLFLVALYPRRWRTGRGKYLWWAVIGCRVLLVCFCLLLVGSIWLLRGGICEPITGNDYGSLAKATAPDGSRSAVVEGQFCHGLMATSDTNEEYWITLNAGPLRSRRIDIRPGGRVGLRWADNQTLEVTGVAHPDERAGDVRVTFKQ